MLAGTDSDATKKQDVGAYEVELRSVNALNGFESVSLKPVHSCFPLPRT